MSNYLSRVVRRLAVISINYFFLLICLNMPVLAQANAPTSSISLQKGLTLEEALKSISKQSGYAIFCETAMLSVNGKRVLAEGVEKATLNESLTKLANIADLRYWKVGKTIYFSEAGTSVSPATEGLPVQEAVTGVVKDDQMQPLPGVSVVIKGRSEGVQTDLEGKFSITASPAETLVFSLLGFHSLEVPLDGQEQLEIRLVPSLESLEEVVVVGYGSQKRKDVTGAVASISAEDFADIPISNVAQALSGTIPGLDVVASGNLPGDGNQIRLRGNRSFNATNDPLIILDGVPFYGSINDINPYDVQSIDVLKDASSAAIYGSRGANGVIIITTKRGQTGPPKFTLESYGGPQIIYGLLPYGNGEQYAERGREAFRQAGNYPDPNTNDELDKMFFDPIEYENLKAGRWYNYPKALLQNGYQHKHQLTVAGGSEAVTYNIAANFYQEEGMLPGRVFDRYSLRSNLDFTLSPKVTAGTSVLLGYNIIEAKTTDGALTWAYQNSPLGQPFNEDGTPNFNPTGDGFQPNPLADLEWDSYRWINKRWSGYLSAFAAWQIIPDLKYRINVSTDINMYNYQESAGYYSISRSRGTANAVRDNSVISRNLIENVLTYDKTFNEDHQLTLTAVQSLQTSKEETNGATVSGVPYELSRFHNIGSASEINGVRSDLREWALQSYVGRVFYGYKSKYLATLSIRADGASQFSPDHKWGYFPSVALAWRISEENFLHSHDWISDIKLRLSYGVTGNQAISPYQTQGALSSTIYVWGETGAFGYRPTELSNTNLKWESTEVYNIGLDFSFLNGRINGNLEFYNTNTYDLLMLRKLPITSGYDDVLENIGSTNNKGFEIALSSLNIVKPDFEWGTDLSFYLNREKITELYNGKVDDVGNRWFIGEPIHVYYDFEKIGIWQLEEADEAAQTAREPGQIKVRDINGDQEYNDLDRKVIGTREPKFVVNLNNRFSYKNWDLALQTYARWGNMIYVGAFNPHSGKRWNQLVFDYWTPENPTQAYPRPDDDVQGALNGSTLAYRDGSFIRLKNVVLGYRIPKTLLDRTFLSSARVYFSGENLWYWTRSEMREFNMEPEWSGDAGTFPAVRTMVLGVNVTF